MRTSVDTEHLPAASVVALSGEIDRSAAGELRRALARAERRARDVVLDLSRTLFLDSTALGAIAAAAKRLRWGGGRLVVVVADRNLRRTLRITAVDLLCTVVETRDAAFAALAEATGEAAPAGS